MKGKALVNISCFFFVAFYINTLHNPHATAYTTYIYVNSNKILMQVRFLILCLTPSIGNLKYI